MINIPQAIILGLIQGVTELFPVSSLGHSILLPGLFGWNINQNSEGFLEFLVATHFATAIVLFCFYFNDWVRIIKGMFRSLREREIKESDPDAKLGWLLVVSTIPAGVIGLLLKDQITSIFLTPRSAAIFLILNGALLIIAEMLRKRAQNSASRPEMIDGGDTRIAHKLSWWRATKVGLMQILALIPGFSRTGATLAGSLMVGLSHEDALRYSFLLATPIIGAAAILEIPALLGAGGAAIATAATGAVAAAVAANFSVKFLTHYFKTKTLTPFAVYCIAVGVVSIIVLSL